MIKKLLWISGTLSLVAMLIPLSIVLGLFLGILPGLALGIMPNVFLYTTAFAIIRSKLSIKRPVAANVTAAGLTLALGFAAATPLALYGRMAFKSASASNVVPIGTLVLRGNIKLQRDIQIVRSLSSDKFAADCDALCAALLDTPGVLSVTLSGKYQSVEMDAITYRLLPKSHTRSAGLSPSKPEEILAHLPSDAKTESGQNWKDEQVGRKAAQDGVISAWALRLATEQTLVAEPGRLAFDQTITILEPRIEGFNRLSIAKIEVRDGKGSVLLRRQRTTADPVSWPLILFPTEGSTWEPRFGLMRWFMFTGERHTDFKPIETLFADTTLARPQIAKINVGQVREQIALALANPAGGLELDPLVDAWMATLSWQSLDGDSLDLLARVVADPQVTRLNRLYDGYAKYVSPKLRTAIIHRLLDPTTPEDARNRLDDLVRSMPPGTFAEPSTDEQSLLGNQALRLKAPALVARIADQGRSGVPQLVRILEQDAQIGERWNRWQILSDIRRAFLILGPDGAEALPAVERLFYRDPSPIANERSDVRAWRAAMVRIGKPVSGLRYPPGTSAQEIERDREEVRRIAARWPEGDS